MVDTLERMAGQLAAWDEAQDGRAVFLACYILMTDAVRSAVDGDRFADPPWVAGLVDRFAGHYFDSIDGGPDVRPVPEPWVLAHAAAVGNDAHPLQLLLAGVNAHINYDLVVTLVETLDDDWPSCTTDDRTRRHGDYLVINDIITETADRVQDEVISSRSPWMAFADRALGRWDERASIRLLSNWRGHVWRNACEILDERDPDERRHRIAKLERQCTRRAHWLLL